MLGNIIDFEFSNSDIDNMFEHPKMQETEWNFKSLFKDFTE